MKIVKTNWGTTANYGQTVYLIRGLFRKKVFLVENGSLWECPEYTVKDSLKKEVTDAEPETKTE